MDSLFEAALVHGIPNQMLTTVLGEARLEDVVVATILQTGEVRLSLWTAAAAERYARCFEGRRWASGALELIPPATPTLPADAPTNPEAAAAEAALKTAAENKRKRAQKRQKKQATAGNKQAAAVASRSKQDTKELTATHSSPVNTASKVGSNLSPNAHVFVPRASFAPPPLKQDPKDCVSANVVGKGSSLLSAGSPVFVPGREAHHPKDL